MPRTFSVKVDGKHRLAIPKELREALEIEPGAIYFVESEGDTLVFAKAENPFDTLAQRALEDHHTGRTISHEELDAELARQAVSGFSQASVWDRGVPVE
ncbi:MAG: AbrB/MazE/SpoVT family DNA-binding domain-containing protein [Dehalococcoidia bacterium]